LTINLAILLLSGCLGLDPMGSAVADDTAGGGTDSGTYSSSFGGMSFPDSVDFGQVLLGDAAATTDLELTNDSNGNVKITDIQLDAGSDFQAESTSPPWVIGPGGQYVVTLSFDPSSTGVQTGTLSFGVETEQDLAAISLSGEGVTDATGTDTGGTSTGTSDGGTNAGSMTYSTSSLAFGTLAVGSTNSASVTLTNGTSDDVEIQSITSSSSVFTTSGITPPTTLSSGNSKTLQVSFTPTAATAYTETVTVQTDAGDKNIAVTGTGEDACTVCAPAISVDTGGSPTSMDFVSLIGIPDSQTVRISNVGDEDLIVRNVYATNDPIGSGDFDVSFSGSTTLAPGDRTSVTVTFTCPDVCLLEMTSLSADWNILHIESDDPSTSDYKIELNGGSGF